MSALDPRGRPAPDEYHEWYAGYVGQVPDGDIVETLRAQAGETAALLRAFPADRADFRYAPGKWTTKEVVRHVLDGEWVFGYRALTIARGDGGPMPGFEQDDWATAADVSGTSLETLVDELVQLRAAGVRMFAALSDEDWMRRGVASGRPFTTRAIAWIMAGHERHHVRVLRERYRGDGA